MNKAIDSDKEYRFSVTNSSIVPLYEPYTKKKIAPNSTVEFVLNGDIAYNTVVKNLEQLAILHKQHGFNFDRNSLDVQVSGGNAEQKIKITILE